MKRISTVLFLSFFAFYAVSPVYAGAPLGTGGCNANEFDTAIGCVPVFNSGNSMTPLMAFISAWGVGIAGGIAFLLILFGGFQIMTSSGDPGRLKAGKELVGAAVSGLLLLIFSTFILRIVGVDILQIFA